jgi:hypothetical protein
MWISFTPGVLSELAARKSKWMVWPWRAERAQHHIHLVIHLQSFYDHNLQDVHYVELFFEFSCFGFHKSKPTDVIWLEKKLSTIYFFFKYERSSLRANPTNCLSATWILKQYNILKSADIVINWFIASLSK